MGVIEASQSAADLDTSIDVGDSRLRTHDENCQVETSKDRCALEIQDRGVEIPHLMLPPPVMDTSTALSGPLTSPDPSPPPSPPPTPTSPRSAACNGGKSPAALCHTQHFPPLAW